MAYNNYTDWKGWNEEEFATYDVGEDMFYSREIGSRLVNPKNASPSVLEIGFGNGSFLGWAKEQKYKVVGSELQHELRRRAMERNFDVVDSIERVPSASLDAVVALDVFEHVPYAALIEMCDAARLALKPGGYLIARFPNGDSPFSLPIQNADATHVHALGAGIIYELMRSTGFTVEELRAPAETPVTLTSKLALPLKRVMRSLFRTYVRFAFLGGATPTTFSLNYMLIARKPHECPNPTAPSIGAVT